MVVDDLERSSLIESDLVLNTEIEEGTGLRSHFYNIMILKGLQISLCDVDVLMSQQTGYRIKIQPVPQTGLCKVVSGSMGRAADIISYLCLLVCLIEDVFQSLFGQGTARAGEKVVVVMDLLIVKVVVPHTLVLQHDLP